MCSSSWFNDQSFDKYLFKTIKRLNRIMCYVIEYLKIFYSCMYLYLISRSFCDSKFLIYLIVRSYSIFNILFKYSKYVFLIILTIKNCCLYSMLIILYYISGKT